MFVCLFVATAFLGISRVLFVKTWIQRTDLLNPPQFNALRDTSQQVSLSFQADRSVQWNAGSASQVFKVRSAPAALNNQFLVLSYSSNAPGCNLMQCVPQVNGAWTVEQLNNVQSQPGWSWLYGDLWLGNNASHDWFVALSPASLQFIPIPPNTSERAVEFKITTPSSGHTVCGAVAKTVSQSYMFFLVCDVPENLAVGHLFYTQNQLNGDTWLPENWDNASSAEIIPDLMVGVLGLGAYSPAVFKWACFEDDSLVVGVFVPNSFMFTCIVLESNNRITDVSITLSERLLAVDLAMNGSVLVLASQRTVYIYLLQSKRNEHYYALVDTITSTPNSICSCAVDTSGQLLLLTFPRFIMWVQLDPSSAAPKQNTLATMRFQNQMLPFKNFGQGCAVYVRESAENNDAQWIVVVSDTQGRALCVELPN